MGYLVDVDDVFDYCYKNEISDINIGQLRAVLRDVPSTKIPTFDVDKVIKELEEYKTKTYYESTSVKNSFPLGANWAFQEAIKIVKRGGANETN